MLRIDFRNSAMGTKSSKNDVATAAGQEKAPGCCKAKESQGDSVKVKLLVLPNNTTVQNAHIGLINTVAEEIVHLINFYDLEGINPGDCELVLYIKKDVTTMDRSRRVEVYRSKLMSDSAILNLVHTPSADEFGVELK